MAAPLRLGSLFSGYGGLDMAVAEHFGAVTVWHSEINPHASKVLACHYPSTPNLGDITEVEWAAVPPVDILAGGFPCQDVSQNGKRAGLRAGKRTGFWSYFREAIEALKPQFVVIENVKGLLNVHADSLLESRSGCLGNHGDRPYLRAAGRVLGDLADLGFDVEWATVRASDVGAPITVHVSLCLLIPQASDGTRGMRAADQSRAEGQTPHLSEVLRDLPTCPPPQRTVTTNPPDAVGNGTSA